MPREYPGEGGDCLRTQAGTASVFGLPCRVRGPIRKATAWTGWWDLSYGARKKAVCRKSQQHLRQNTRPTWDAAVRSVMTGTHRAPVLVTALSTQPAAEAKNLTCLGGGEAESHGSYVACPTEEACLAFAGPLATRPVPSGKYKAASHLQGNPDPESPENAQRPWNRLQSGQGAGKSFRLKRETLPSPNRVCMPQALNK